MSWWSFVPGKTDRHPIAYAGNDVVVQPYEIVMLNGIESWDDKKIINYTWALAKGNKSVVMEVTCLLLAFDR